jgi:hypothetical protein
MPHKQSWTERTGNGAQAVPHQSDDIEQHFHRQAFKQPHTSLGVLGHIIHMTGVFVPLVAGELVQDATKYKKTVRIASIGTALAYELLYTVKEEQRRKQQEAKLAECRGKE